MREQKVEEERVRGRVCEREKERNRETDRLRDLRIGDIRYRQHIGLNMKSEGNELHGFKPSVLVETVEAAAVEAEDILAALAGVTKRLLAEAQGSSSSQLSLVEEAPRERFVPAGGSSAGR